MQTESIHPHNPSRQAWIVQLYYEVFPRFAHFVSRNGGNEEQAREAFQEALVLYYEQGHQKPLDSPEGYLFGIAKNVFRQHLRQESLLSPIDGVEPLDEVGARWSGDKLLGVLKVAGQKCLDLLQSFYYEQLSMDELAQRFGYRSERSATVQKYKCLEKVREEVKERSLTYEDFAD